MLRAALAAHALHGAGVCVRAGSDEQDPDVETCAAGLAQLFSLGGLTRQDVDLLFDFRSVPDAKTVRRVSAPATQLVERAAKVAALVAWLNERAGQRLVASVLVDIEVPRALRRSQPGVLGAVAATLARIERIELDAAVRATAAAYVDPLLRSPDAIHLATADQLVASGKDVSSFVTYDERLAEAARASSFSVAAPGATV